MYSAAIYRVLTQMENEPVPPKRVAIVAVGMIAITWMAALA